VRPVHGSVVLHGVRNPRHADIEEASVWCGGCLAWIPVELPCESTSEALIDHEHRVGCCERESCGDREDWPGSDCA
jgi:hypothetical protein